MIITGYIGIAIAFIIITAVLLFFLISSKIHVLIKVVIIPVVLWYGLALFFTPDNLRGWPTDQPIPDDSRIISLIINEPTVNSSGAIYLWVIDKKFKETILDPRNVFCYHTNNTPRVYRLPYSKELHKRLIEVLQKASQTGGFIIVKNLFGKGEEGKKGEKGKMGKSTPESGNLKFDVINPRIILKKGGD